MVVLLMLLLICCVRARVCVCVCVCVYSPLCVPVPTSYLQNNQITELVKGVFDQNTVLVFL